MDVRIIRLEMYSLFAVGEVNVVVCVHGNMSGKEKLKERERGREREIGREREVK